MDLNIFNDVPSLYPILEKNNIIKDTKSTLIKINQIKEDYNEPELYTSEKILSIFNKESNKDNFSEYLKKINISKYFEDNFKMKEIRIDFDNDNLSVLNKKGGRKANQNRGVIHDKMYPDNIIKKIKSSSLKYLLLFLNNILNIDQKLLYNKIELLRLDYKYFNSLKKEQEYELLNMKLKDLFSKDISCKYNKKSDYNKKIIENILKDANDTNLFVF